MRRNLDEEMHRTGRVAIPDLRGNQDAIAKAAEAARRSENKVDTESTASPVNPVTWHLVRDNPRLDVQYGDAFAATVGACRFQVARRLGVGAENVEAGIVTFRWTIEPSGHVRDASAVADSPTNEAVTACATHIVINHVLLNAVEEPLSLEWTYSFHRLAVQAPISRQDVSK